jgi:hypothetical protein
MAVVLDRRAQSRNSPRNVDREAKLALNPLASQDISTTAKART